MAIKKRREEIMATGVVVYNGLKKFEYTMNPWLIHKIMILSHTMKIEIYHPSLIFNFLILF